MLTVVTKELSKLGMPRGNRRRTSVRLTVMMAVEAARGVTTGRSAVILENLYLIVTKTVGVNTGRVTANGRRRNLDTPEIRKLETAG